MERFLNMVSLLRAPGPPDLPQSAGVWGCPFPKEVFFMCLPSAWHQNQRFQGTFVRGDPQESLVCEITMLPAPEGLTSQAERGGDPVSTGQSGRRARRALGG